MLTLLAGVRGGRLGPGLPGVVLLAAGLYAAASRDPLLFWIPLVLVGAALLATGVGAAHSRRFIVRGAQDPL